MSSPLSPEAKRSVFIVWLVIFLDLLGFGIVLPTLAYFVNVFPVPEAALRLGQSFGITEPAAVFVGLIQTSYSLLQFLAAPFWGLISDRIGRRPVLVISMGGFAVAWVLFAFAPSMLWLLVARVLAGAFGANISTAQAYMADVFPNEKRAKGMGLVGMAFGLGFVFGPALGALLATDTVMAVFIDPGSALWPRARIIVPGLFAAGLSASAFALALFKLTESLPPAARGQPTDRTGQLRELLDALKSPQVGEMLLVYFAIVTGFASLEAMFSEFNYDHLGIPHGQAGLVFTAIGLTMAVVQGGVIGRLSERWGSPRVLRLGLIGLIVSMNLFAFQKQLNPGVPPLMWLLIMSVAIGAFFSLANPSVLAIISTHAKARAQGETMGFTSSAATLGRVVGPLGGGLVYAWWGPAWPFVSGSGLVALGLLVFAWRRGSD